MQAAAEPIRPIPTNGVFHAGKVALGRMLFHDERLSKDNSVVVCQLPRPWRPVGDDGRQVSVGVDNSEGPINAPTVFNTAFNFKQFWDGRAETLEDQIDGPVQSAIEMASLWPDVVAKLYQDESYPGLFDQIYPDGINRENVKNALAEFMRSLTTPNSRFDQWLNGDQAALNGREKLGYSLFKSYGCVSCHQGAAVGGNMFQVFGVLNEYFKRRGNITEADMGRFNVTGNEADMHAFKVPSLRMAAPHRAVSPRRQCRDAARSRRHHVRVPVGQRSARRGQGRHRRVHQDTRRRVRGAVAMTNSIKFGLVASVVIVATAVVLYFLARENDPEHYRVSIAQVQQIQQLASDWSVETARVRSDPMADYDALVAFVPRMDQLKESLLASVNGIPDVPDRLANDVSAYASAVDAKEERIERFKTANSVVRNSARYLPLAAANIVQDEASPTDLAREVGTVANDFNDYLASPSDAAKGRLTAVVERLGTQAAGLPERLANAVVNFVAHATVLLDHQGPTDEIFEQATSKRSFRSLRSLDRRSGHRARPDAAA